MRKIIKLASLCILVSSASVASGGATHLEQLKSRYPYGLIGDDYGLLTAEDLAVNTCNTLEITPFSEGKNMSYSYWQCFSIKNAKIGCDHAGYDPSIRETAYLEISAQNESGLQSYLARDAMDMRDCQKYLLSWKQKTRNEQYVCVSGSYGRLGGVENGHKEMDWIFDKFKTRKGCESHRSECSLKEISGLPCLMPNK